MIKLRELSKPTSCLNSADIDEPIFVLRANDELAPEIVRAWAVAYCRAKVAAQQFTLSREEKYREAMQLAREMEAWRDRQALPDHLRKPLGS